MKKNGCYSLSCRPLIIDQAPAVKNVKGTVEEVLLDVPPNDVALVAFVLKKWEADPSYLQD